MGAPGADVRMKPINIKGFSLTRVRLGGHFMAVAVGDSQATYLRAT